MLCTKLLTHEFKKVGDEDDYLWWIIITTFCECNILLFHSRTKIMETSDSPTDKSFRGMNLKFWFEILRSFTLKFFC